MNLRAKLFVTVLFTLLCVNGYSQWLTADLNFDGLFDNREFKGDMQPQTIYGMRLMPEIGIDAAPHIIRVGFSKIWEFGADDKIDPELILYYKFMGPVNYFFGAIPRNNLQRQLPDAFLYDSIAFFEPTIKGTLIQHCYRDVFETELYCNWFSRQTETQREAFRIVWDGYVHSGVLGAGWFAAMTHFAKPKEPGHFIYEKFQLYPYLTLDLTEVVGQHFKLKANAGVLCSLVRCRKDGDWHSPTGFLGDIQIWWKGFDVKSTVFAGGSQQPFLNDPEAGLRFHRSDPFYNHTFYNKTELGVLLVSHHLAQLGFRWNMHFTPGTPMHNQQLITLKYRIGMNKKLHKYE